MRAGPTARWFLLVALLGSSSLAPEASAATTVEIAEVTVPASDGQKKAEKRLRSALRQAAKEVDFGETKSVTIRAKVIEWKVEEQGDVLRVTCTLVGRLEGGKSARSHVSFGGRPKEREKLEKQVVAMVARGVMTRLAQLAQR